MNKLSRLVCFLVVGSPFALYFLTHFGYLDLRSSEELYEDIIVMTPASNSRTHRPPVTRPSSEEIILSREHNNLSSMVTLFVLTAF